MSPRSKEQNEEIREASLKKIFDACLELFGTKGYEATSIAQIAQKAGISKGLIYNYFSSKEELLEQMVNNLIQEGDKVVDELFVEDPRQTLQNLISFVFSWLRENQKLNHVLVGLSAQIDKFQFVHDLAQQKMNGYTVMLEDLLNQLEFPHAKTEARILSTVFDGIALHYMMLKEDYPLDEVEQMLLEKYCQPKMK